MQKQSSAKLYQAAIVIVGWFALITQFYVFAVVKQTGFSEMLIRYFSYFTIQTNLLVAICFTSMLCWPGSAPGRFFSSQQTVSAITVYIIIVGIIYNVILRFLWDPKGMQLLVDELLHSVIPVMVFIYWLVFVRKDQLKWKNVFSWLIYPFAYIIYILIRGAVSGFYPYPFINTRQLGMNKVLVNSLGIAVLFTIVSLLLLFVGKSLNKKSTPL